MVQISIIIVSYNTKDITERCLRSIDTSAEIIVVDNASSDGSVEMIQKKFPKVKLIASKTNLGFAAGNNLGMHQATGDYFLLLNSDAFLEKNTLTKCLSYMDTTDVLGCKLTYEDGRLQPSAGYLPDPVNTFLWIWCFAQAVHPKDPAWFAKNRQVGWVTGAFMFLKREVFEKTGGFDEKYFMYAEEVDWCKRMQQANYKVFYIADFSIIHLLGASQANRDKAYIREMQGVVYYFKKYYPYLPMQLIIKYGNLVRELVFEFVNKPERAKIYKEIFESL